MELWEMELTQIKTTHEDALDSVALAPWARGYHKGAIEALELVERKINKWMEEAVDKKMAKVSRKIRTAEKDIREHKSKAATKTLKKAEKENVRLTKIDREERDPFIEKCKKDMKHKGKKK
jgi:glutamyl-tRNA reductase